MNYIIISESCVIEYCSQLFKFAGKTIISMEGSGKELNKKSGYARRIVKWGFRNCILIVCFLSFQFKAAAPGASVAFIFKSEPVEAYTRLINAVVMVESSGDTLAFNLIEEAYGAFQIRPIRLLDYYQRTGRKYKIEDCYNYKISKEIFLYYAIRNGNLDYQTIARNWNGSGKMTLDYWKKVLAHL